MKILITNLKTLDSSAEFYIQWKPHNLNCMGKVHNWTYDSWNECVLCLQRATLLFPCSTLLTVSVLLQVLALLSQCISSLLFLVISSACSFRDIHVVLLWYFMGWYQLRIKRIEPEGLRNMSQIVTKPKRKK